VSARSGRPPKTCSPSCPATCDPAHPHEAVAPAEALSAATGVRHACGPHTRRHRPPEPCALTHRLRDSAIGECGPRQREGAATGPARCAAATGNGGRAVGALGRRMPA
jgi:hypothetical protein